MKEKNNNKYNDYKLGGAALAILGFMYIILSIEGMEFWEICLFFGILFASLGIKIYIGACKNDYNPNSKIDRLFWRFLIDKENLNLKEFADQTENHFYISKFKDYLNNFFEKRTLNENEEIQEFADQIYYNILRLQQQRIAKNNLKVNYSFKRKKGTDDLPPVREKCFFDGKYNVTNITEDTIGKKIFSKIEDNSLVYEKSFNASFGYTITEVNQIGENEITCPNCGAKSNRSNLLDGCDYCKAKFNIEDLSKRISAFNIFSDVDTLIKVGSKFASWIGSLLKITMLCLILAFPLIFVMDNPESSGIFAIDKFILILIFGVLLGVAVAIIGFVILFSPFILIAYFTHLKRKEALEKHLEEEEENLKIIENIKSFDPLFSRTNFQSSIQNKIVSIYYADNEKQINAFSKIDLSNYLSKYTSVVDVEFRYFNFKEYTYDTDYQKIKIDIEVELIRYNGTVCSPMIENLNITLIKSSNCKSQSICAPTLSRCNNCGSSMSIFQGKKCPSCGNEINLENQDWVIVEYK